MKKAGLVLALIGGILALILGIVSFSKAPSPAFSGLTALILGIGLVLWTAAELGSPKKD